MSDPDSDRIVRLSVIFYLPMLVTAFFVKPPGTFRVADLRLTGYGLLAAAALGVLTILASRLFARHTGWGRAMHTEFRRVLGALESRHILALSLLSAAGEEVLFRGVLQARLGLLITALLFAALHMPYRRAMVPWTAFAFVLGLALGGLTEAFGSLWPAIVLHFVVNYFNLHDIAEAGPVQAGAGPDE